jgi:hypothetical protein
LEKRKYNEKLANQDLHTQASIKKFNYKNLTESIYNKIEKKWNIIDVIDLKKI